MEKPIFSDDVKFGYKQGNSLQKRLCLFTANWPLMPLHLFLYVGTDLVLPAGLPAKGQVEVRAPVGRTQLEKKCWKICNHPRTYLLHKSDGSGSGGPINPTSGLKQAHPLDQTSLLRVFVHWGLETPRLSLHSFFHCQD